MEKRVIALGFFDGVHLGHGGLLREAKRLAAGYGCAAAALTFDRHPSELVTGHAVPLITAQADRAYLMRSLYGTDEVLFLHFDRAMMEMPWDEFLSVCLGDLGACHVVCGWDFRFGHRGLGDAEKLRGFCAAHGIGCTVVGEIDVDGVPVHSTAIRALLEAGELEPAARLLGHPHCFSGTVISGKRLGRTIGVPTANVALPQGVVTLPHGVYVTQVEANGVSYPAVTNIGSCPTVTDRAPVIAEPWLLDFDGDLYGTQIRIRFYRWLRAERKFPSLEALRAEILRNAAQTKRYFEVNCR